MKKKIKPSFGRTMSSEGFSLDIFLNKKDAKMAKGGKRSMKR